MAIHNWLTGIGFPETPDQFKKQTTDSDGLRELNEQWSDGSLAILNSNYRKVANANFRDLFPTSLTSLEFDATESDIQYFTAEVNFKYTVYNMVDPNGDPLK